MDLLVKLLPPHEQEHTTRNLKVFIEQPLGQMNATRSSYSDNILSQIRQAFVMTNQTQHCQGPSESLCINNGPG
ncbi:unnamed protein product [Heterobilharzia americana]|nr:unnamed protein product [Heterobilharzia americana]CAH8542804.1 unnamed protein product [Heterobilharzia americana]